MGVHINPFTGKLDVVDSPSGDFSDLTLDLGTETAPSISFDGDPNTGIYSPGADQLAISTNGTGRLFVTSAGSIGVGTSTPNKVGASKAITVNGTDAAIELSTGDSLKSSFYTNGTDTVLSNSVAGALRFYTDSAERLRITSTGQLSHIGGGSSGSPAVGFNGSAPSNSLVIDSAGKVGLGTSSPSRTLDVTGTARVTSVLTLGSYIQGTTQLDLYGDSSSSSGVRLDSSGRLGVGTTSPGDYNASADDLVVASSGSTGITIASNSANYGSIFFADGTTGAAEYAGYLQYSHADNSFAFGSNGDEAFRIDSSRRLLVGTTISRGNFYNTSGQDPKVQIEGTSYITSAVSNVINSNDTFGARHVFGKSRGTTVGSNTIVQSGDECGVLTFQGSDGAEFVDACRITAQVDGTPGSNDMPGRLVFSTTAATASSPTERMRIRNDGSTWIGTTTGSINTTSFGVSIDNIAFSISKDRAAANSVLNVYGNAGHFRTMGDGDAENTNNSYGALSDVKLKENIIDASSQWDDIKALKVRKYNFKEETGFNTHTQIGLIAQEVELVSPGIVGQSVDDKTGEVTKSVSYSVLYMKAVKALQEAMERIETLEAKVAALEAN